MMANTIYTIELYGSSLYSYERINGNRTLGWGLVSSTDGVFGSVVSWSRREDAERYISERPVFFRGAKIVEEERF